jgi:hydrogenase maturation protease
MTSARRVSVVGVGNVLYRDEGVGVYAAHYLRRAFTFTPDIEIADGALLGFSLMDLVADDATMIVLDALLADAAPGTVYRLPTDRLLDLGPDVTPTAHEVDPIHVLKRARALGERAEMVLLGIVPADAQRMEVGLTAPLADALPRFVDAAVAEIRAHGVDVEPAGGSSLDDVLQALSHSAHPA